MSSRPGSRVFLALGVLLFVLGPGCARRPAVPRVFISADASWHSRVAAAEIGRYVYVRTGLLPRLETAASLARVSKGALVVAEKGESLLHGLDDAAAARIAALGAEDYWLKTLAARPERVVLVAGGGPALFPATAPALNQTVIVLPEAQ